MGVMLSVLCSYMGAIELVFIVRDLTHQLALHRMRLGNGEDQSDISVLQNRIRASISALETVDIESVEQMQDGVLYQNGYRIENEQSINKVAQQWDERRKALCVSEENTLDSPSQSTVSNGGIQIDRTRNGDSSFNDDDEPNEQNNYRPIVRDDRTGRRKAFKKRHSSSSQSSDSIRLSREEELKMFTSLEEEENRNSSVAPINSNTSFINSQKNIDPSFHEKQKYDAEAWSNKKPPSSYHDSELWKRERATSIVEEGEDITNSSLRNSSYKRPVRGTADKPSRKTSHEKDAYATGTHACEPLEKVDHYRPCTLSTTDENVAEENARDTQTTAEPNRMIKKVDNLPNLNHYFNEALTSEIGEKKNYDADAITPLTPMAVDKPLDLLVADSRDARSFTVYSRSGSESSNNYRTSISRDSSSNTDSNADIDSPRQRYGRTDSTNSFIQDELDSEEYHHHHRFSMNADALEYIRGRDDWRDHTENILNNRYRRQASNIRIREEIDSDEYHHDRKLSDLIEIAYLDAESIKSLPSSFKDNTFDRYYVELQRSISGQLSNDIEQNIAQKQIILLDSTEIEAAEGYVYPLPDIILDRASDNGDESYVVEQLDSDYSNLSESEDDIQSVIEVNCRTAYAGEVITTLDMDTDGDEMIEVTLWDLHDDLSRERSSESSVEIISTPNENQMFPEEFVEVPPSIDDKSEKLDVTHSGVIAPDIIPSTQNITSAETSKSVNEAPLSTVEATESSYKITAKDQWENTKIEAHESTLKKAVNNSKEADGSAKKSVTFKDQTTTSDSSNSNESQDSPSQSSSQTKTEDRLLEAARGNSNQRPVSTGIDVSKSFIGHESSSSAQESSSANSTATTKKPKVVARAKISEVDALIMDGSMGAWFH